MIAKSVISLIIQVQFKPSADGPATSWHDIHRRACNGQRPILCPEHHNTLLDGIFLNHSPDPIKIIASSKINKGASGMISSTMTLQMGPGDTLKSIMEASIRGGLTCTAIHAFAVSAV